MVSNLIVKLVRVLQRKWNGLRLRLVITWLRMQGVAVGSSVYIGKRVTFNLNPGSQLILRDAAAISDDCTITVSPGGVLDIGESVFINHHCDLASSTHLAVGKYSLFGPYCMIIDSDHRYDNLSCPIDFQGGEYEAIGIDEEVWLGTRVIVLRGVHLGKHCVVGAGAVVNTDIAPFSLAVGVPARVVKAFGESKEDSRVTLAGGSRTR